MIIKGSSNDDDVNFELLDDSHLPSNVYKIFEKVKCLKCDSRNLHFKDEPSNERLSIRLGFVDVDALEVYFMKYVDSDDDLLVVNKIENGSVNFGIFEYKHSIFGRYLLNLYTKYNKKKTREDGLENLLNT